MTTYKEEAKEEETGDDIMDYIDRCLDQNVSTLLPSNIVIETTYHQK